MSNADLEQQIESIPSELYELYDSNFSRQRCPEGKAEAIFVFLLFIFAARPIKLPELKNALSFRLGNKMTIDKWKCQGAPHQLDD